MKPALTTMLLLILFPIFAGEPPSDKTAAIPPFFLHTDNESKIQYYLPSDWRITLHQLGYRDVHRADHADTSSITVTTERGIDAETADRWNRWKEWYIAGAGTALYTILDRGKLSSLTPSEKVIIVQYQVNGRVYLERMAHRTARGKMISIVCRASLEQFQRHAKTCDAVMGSAHFLDEEQDRNGVPPAGK